jgi:uncharacterized LabA/DUF88 family protein
VAAVRFQSVGLFVDWNSRLRLAPADLQAEPVERARFSLNQLGKTVARELCNLDASIVYRVRLRIYHGWTAGISPTLNRRSLTSLTEFHDPEQIFPSQRVLCPTPIELGDRLLDGRDERLVTRMSIHLPNTLRRQGGDDFPTEKMVDCALAVDLLSWARTEPASLAIILSSDDDIIPAVFVAESWMIPLGGIVRIIRPTARGDSRYLNLEGLLVS